MHIGLLCATHRGISFFHKLLELQPKAEYTVFSFREEPIEPPYIEEIKRIAEINHCRFIETRQVANPKWLSFWASTPMDILFTVSWRYLIPPTIYSLPRLGTYVFHDSLLPEYRGFSPTVWAIINGEDHTGVSLFEIAEDVDSGDLIDQKRIPINKDDSIDKVMDRVTDAYLELLEINLPALLTGTASKTPQDQSLATFTCKRLPSDNRINWLMPADKILDLIRAVTHPYPGAFTFLNERKMTIWRASKPSNEKKYVGAIPGRVVEVYPNDGVVVLTGNGSILIQDLQIEGENECEASQVLNSIQLTLS